MKKTSNKKAGAKKSSVKKAAKAESQRMTKKQAAAAKKQTASAEPPRTSKKAAASKKPAASKKAAASKKPDTSKKLPDKPLEKVAAVAKVGPAKVAAGPVCVSDDTCPPELENWRNRLRQGDRVRFRKNSRIAVARAARATALGCGAMVNPPQSRLVKGSRRARARSSGRHDTRAVVSVVPVVVVVSFGVVVVFFLTAVVNLARAIAGVGEVRVTTRYGRGSGGARTRPIPD